MVDYPGEYDGKTAHYMLRWVATTGQTGPWSEDDWGGRKMEN